MPGEVIRFNRESATPKDRINFTNAVRNLEEWLKMRLDNKDSQKQEGLDDSIKILQKDLNDTFGRVFPELTKLVNEGKFEEVRKRIGLHSSSSGKDLPNMRWS